MFSLKGLLKYSATPAGVILIAVVVIQALLSGNAKLKKEMEQLHNEIITQRMLTAALKDSLKNIGDYHPLPETVKVTVPTPAVTETGTTPKEGKPYAAFTSKTQWENWYRKHCTGIIEFDTTQLWENGQGARVQGRLCYGTGNSQDNYLLITPAGNWKYKPPKTTLQAGIEILLNKRGEVSLGLDVTYKKWGPALRIDTRNTGTPKTWIGVRKIL